MARQPMVTRTITTTVANVLCLDTELEAPVTKTVSVPRTYKSTEKLEKAVKNAIETETLRVVQVKDFSTVNKLYGMSEQKFIENAEILPDRVKADA